jgi:hypothetical protein
MALTGVWTVLVEAEVATGVDSEVGREVGREADAAAVVRAMPLLPRPNPMS